MYITSSRAAKMSCVPLPWWTSQSTISTRAAPGPPRRLGRDRRVVEQAEPHRAVGHGVVAGRTHERERVPRAPAHRRQRRLDRGARRQPRGVPASRRHRGVRIELAAPPGQRLPAPRGSPRGGRPRSRHRSRTAAPRWSRPRSVARARSVCTASRRAGDSGCPRPGSCSRKRLSVMTIVLVLMLVFPQARGSSKLNTLPPPGASRTSTSLPWSRTISRTNARPRPGALLAGGEERREDLLAQLGRHAGAVVADLDTHAIALDGGARARRVPRAPPRRRCGSG